ncbi:hypothetical protein BDCR2A_01496 [Borrelia duttonii CR2A]|uniref:Variable large protein n=1 Tax=Borrelia duttonii CR2A TaxID=1432657 RepID=W6TGS5_9SPIR|nr:hypothetical protein BDCR2A_01496 [Borrelia duttonii CR2A]
MLLLNEVVGVKAAGVSAVNKVLRMIDNNNWKNSSKQSY